MCSISDSGIFYPTIWIHTHFQYVCVCAWRKTLYVCSISHCQVTKWQLKIQSILIIWGSYVLLSCCNHWISKYWTIAPRGNKGLGSWEPLVTIFLSPDQYMTLSLCVFQFKDSLTFKALKILMSTWVKVSLTHGTHNQRHCNSCHNEIYLTHKFSPYDNHSLCSEEYYPALLHCAWGPS